MHFRLWAVGGGVCEAALVLILRFLVDEDEEEHFQITAVIKKKKKKPVSIVSCRKCFGSYVGY